MANDSLMFGAGGLVIGAILGMMSSGPNFDGLEKSIGEKIEAAGAASATTDEQLAALSDKIAALEAAIAAGAEESAASGAEVKGQIDGVVSALNDTIASSGAAQSEALKGAIIAQGDIIQDALAGQTETISTQLGELGEGVAAAATSAAAIQSTMASHHGGAASVAATAEGAAVAAEDNAAEAATTEAATAPTAVTPPPPPPEPKGTAAGETELFLDGAVRVFVSGVDTEAGTARVAVNGFKTQVLGTYEAVTFEVDGKTCELILDNVADGHVEMSPNCPE